jgi:tetratricopeptide (TPR) repeat protein
VAIGAPDPGQAGSLDDYINQLRTLKAWVGNPSITRITQDIGRTWTAAGRPASELPARATVGYCLRPGRTRPNPDLLLAIVDALVGGDAAEVDRWRRALRTLLGEAELAGQVSATDRLPADLPEFTGREDLLDGHVVSVLAGMAGIGKTALAIRIGHRIMAAGGADRVLFVNLRGYDPDRPAAEPAAVLDAFLRLLGVPGDAIPLSLDKRAALYLATLAGTRTLVVLDNAASTDQVAPLLPGDPGCPVLVTSRDTLDIPGARRLQVPLFDRAEALDLLRRTAGPARVDADPDTAAGIADLLGHLPLALAVIGSHLRDHPTWTLADYPPSLTGLALEGGVRPALALSDAGLAAGPRRLLRLLALHPGPAPDRHAAAALADQDVSATDADLAVLTAASLLHPRGPGRHLLHDLTRAYAAERAALDEPASQARRALTRLYDHYAGTAAAAMDAVYPWEAAHRPAGPRGHFASAADAAAWLDAEQANLLATARHAARTDPGHTVHQAATLHRHLATRGAYPEAIALHQLATGLATDPAAQVRALNQSGQTLYAVDRYEEATDCHQRALRLAEATGDTTGIVAALNGLARTHNTQGRITVAHDCLARALEHARAAGDTCGEIDALHGLGHIDYMQGRYQPSMDAHRRELDLARASGNLPAEMNALTRLGLVHMQQGRYEAATGCLDRAHEQARATGNPIAELKALSALSWLYQQTGRLADAAECSAREITLARTLRDRNGEAVALINRGYLHHAQGEDALGRARYREAFRLARELGDLNLEYEAEQGRGRTELALGDPVAAVAAHESALALAARLDQPLDLARGHDGLAHAHRALGAPEAARTHWQRTLDLLAEHDTPAAADVTATDVRANLARL